MMFEKFGRRIENGTGRRRRGGSRVEERRRGMS